MYQIWEKRKKFTIKKIFFFLLKFQLCKYQPQIFKISNGYLKKKKKILVIDSISLNVKFNFYKLNFIRVK